ncbi:phage portal protein [Roseomonas sp. BN140053]|uniref:phage portal protein n=1 Tax=Roseomonas sp. BN140053 TaxID=3391898 RepID=UPI0039E9BD97
MGVLSRLRGLLVPEVRALTPADFPAAWGEGGARAAYGTTLAENFSAVGAAVDAIAGTIAAQPILLHRLVNGGRVEAPEHPVARLFRRPNPHMTGPDLVQTLLASVLLTGNGLLRIEHDGAGRPAALWPVPWHAVQMVRLASGAVVYDVSEYDSLSGSYGGKPRRFREYEIFHLRDRTGPDGLVGISRISRAGAVIQNALAVQDFSLNGWRNGATPSGVISFPQSLSFEQAQQVRDRLRKEVTGTRNSRAVLILENGATWAPMAISPEDAELLGSRRFSVEEVARLFGVPSAVINENSHSTFSNSETLIRYFAQGTLSHWCRKVEAEAARSLLGTGAADATLTVDLSGLLRGDPQTRWASWKTAIEAGVLDPAEVRLEEGWSARPA